MVLDTSIVANFSVVHFAALLPKASESLDQSSRLVLLAPKVAENGTCT